MYKSPLRRPVVIGLVSLTICLVATIWSGLSNVSSGKTTGNTVANSLGGNDSVRILAQRANDIIYNPLDDKLYISVPSSASPTGNSLRKINPRDLTIGAPVWIGSEPNRLSLSSDNQTLWVGLDGAFSLRRFDTTTGTPGQQFQLGFEFFAGYPYTRYGIADFAVSPTDTNVVGVARLNGGSTANFNRTAVYNNGIALPGMTGFTEYNSTVAFSQTGSMLFGSGPSGFRTMGVTETGISHTTTYPLCYGVRIKYVDGKVFCSTGQVIDAENPTLLTTFAGSDTKAFTADGSVDRAYYAVRDDMISTTWNIKAWDTNTYALLGTLPITNVAGTVTNLIRWGENGLAFTTTAGKVYIIQTSLVPTNEPVPTPSETPFVTPTPTPTPIDTSYQYIPLPANMAALNPDNQRLYVSVPSRAGALGNRIAIIDPAAVNIDQSVWVGSEPTLLAFSSDRQKLYVELDGARTIREFGVATATAGSEYPVGIDTYNGPMGIAGLAASPDSPTIIAVSRHSLASSGHHGIALYSAGTQYPQVGGDGYSVAFSNSTTRMFGTGSPGLEIITNTAEGVASIARAPFSSGGRISYAGGRVYGAEGQVIDPNDISVPGSFILNSSNSSTTLFTVDTALNRAFYVLYVDGAFLLRAYDTTTFLSLGEVSLPGVSSPTSIARWGTNGLAITQSSGPIVLVRSKLVNESEAVPAGTSPPSPSPTPAPAPAFVRRVFIQNSDMVLNNADSKLYVTVPNIGGSGTANSISRINPATGVLEASVPIGDNPKRLAVSPDGGTMYVSFNSPPTVRRFDVQTQTPGPQFAANTNGSPIADLAISPDSADKVVVAAGNGSTAMYVNGVMLPNRPNETPGNPFGGASIGQVRFSSSANLLYGYNNGSTAFNLFRVSSDQNGLLTMTNVRNLLSGFNNDVQFAEGKLFTSDGRIVNPETNRILGTLGAQGRAIAVDTQLRKAFIASPGVITVFDIDTYLQVGRIVVPVPGDSIRLVRWGINGLALNYSNGSDPPQVFIIQSPAVSGAVPIPVGHLLQQSWISVNESAGSTTIPVSRTGDLSIASTVNFATANGTAEAGLDYGAVSGTLSFAPGEVTKNVVVPIFEDPIYEGQENFSLTLSNPTGSNSVLVQPSTMTVEINNNDFPPAIRVNAAFVAETRGGTSTIVNVPVTLSNPSVQTVSVNFMTSNITATAGSDYVAANGTVSFDPLETAKAIPVTILGDNVLEGNETFAIQLSNATNGAIVGGPATVTIQDYIPEVSPPFDFDGDGKTDIGIFRPLATAEWWINRSSTGQTFALQFGASTDRIAPADYTGDGKADITFFRPSSGEWYVLRSEDNSFFAFPFGTNGDSPVPADYDADGKADFAVFRPSSGTWFISQSGGGGTRIFQFGVPGDVPVAADYDGDAKADAAIFRPAVSGGEWWVQRSTAGLLAMQFGANTDKPVQGDYTGDGKADVAIWRPASGEWFIVRSEDFSFFAFPFGANGDVPSPGDYDGDGKFDPTVFRPSAATWFIARSTAGTQIVQFGANGDRPIPNAFVP